MKTKNNIFLRKKSRTKKSPPKIWTIDFRMLDNFSFISFPIPLVTDYPLRTKVRNYKNIRYVVRFWLFFLRKSYQQFGYVVIERSTMLSVVEVSNCLIDHKGCLRNFITHYFCFSFFCCIFAPNSKSREKSPLWKDILILKT